jgi:hypothetical protein
MLDTSNLEFAPTRAPGGSPGTAGLLSSQTPEDAAKHAESLAQLGQAIRDINRLANTAPPSIPEEKHPTRTTRASGWFQLTDGQHIHFTGTRPMTMTEAAREDEAAQAAAILEAQRKAQRSPMARFWGWLGFLR